MVLIPAIVTLLATFLLRRRAAASPADGKELVP